jgi:hypothetical protein
MHFRCDMHRAPRSRVKTKRAEMLGWLFWHLERIERIHAVADALISEFGVEAHAEARRRQREAKSVGAAREWRGVASVIARRMSRQVILDAPTRPALLEYEPVSEPKWIAPEPSQPFRIQFVCGTPDDGPTNLTEKCIRAADDSAAIVAAANTEEWPPRTIGLRILDSEGREIFARDKARKVQTPAP